MLSARDQFTENIRRVRQLGGLGLALSSLTHSAVDVSDVWRAQIVLAVSALDHFIHEITWAGMIASAKGLRPKTDAYLRFDLPLKATEAAIAGATHEIWMGDWVREKHSWQSFQDPDKIADAIRLISSVKLWEAVGSELGFSAKDVKTRLRLIVERRNKIAHEADQDPTNPGFRWPIDETMTNETVEFIEKLVFAIDNVCAEVGNNEPL